jgi:HEAT repeat protein
MAGGDSKLVKLLSDGTLEQRTAAAIVIGELAPIEPAVISCLADAARDPDRTLRLKAIEALGKIGSAKARDVLYPLLDQNDTRDAAARALALAGNPVVTFARKAYPTASLAKRHTLIRILSLIRSKDAMSFLMDLLHDPSPPAAHDVATIFKQETGTLDSKARRQLSQQVRTAMGQKDFRRMRAAVESAIELLNHLRDPDSATLLLEFASVDHPPSTRRAALTGLRWMLPGYGQKAEPIRLLLSFIEEEDFINIASPSLEALLPLEIPKGSAKALIALAESRHPLVRKFALQKMSGLDTPEATATLVEALSDADPMVRQLAARSIEEQPGAWKVVVAELSRTTDPELAWRMVRSVKRVGDEVNRPALEKLAKDAIARLETDDPAAEAMLHLILNLAPDVHYETLKKRAQHWKRKKEYGPAERCLSFLTQTEEFDDEDRFELAMLALRASSAPAGSVTRDSDLPLTLLRGLIRGGSFPVDKKLQTESRSLEPPDLFYLGFHLVEGSETERAIGKDLLHKLVETTPRSKVGKSAKSKLKVEGLL